MQEIQAALFLTATYWPVRRMFTRQAFMARLKLSCHAIGVFKPR